MSAVPSANFVLETVRYRLRLFGHDDLDFLAGLYADPEVMRYFPNLETRDYAAKHIEKFAEACTAKGHTLWAVEEKATGHLVGRVGLWPLEQTAEVELGYMIVHFHWRRGAATETSAACLNYGIVELKLPFIAAICVAENLPSRHVLDKLGFQYLRDDRFYDTDVMYHRACSPLART
jgi:RimJ/RimL family protein N-acetyltransferase